MRTLVNFLESHPGFEVTFKSFSIDKSYCEIILFDRIANAAHKRIVPVGDLSNEDVFSEWLDYMANEIDSLKGEV